MTTKTRATAHRDTKTAPPVERPARARSAPKRARPAAGKPYDEAARKAALEQLERDGMATTHKATGIPKGTLSRWARDAGIDLGARARARTAAASAAVEAKAAEVRLTVVDRLEGILEQQLRLEAELGALELAAVEAARSGDLELVVGVGGPRWELTGTAAQTIARARAILDVTPKRDAVGSRTRSVHDLNLLKGEATERGTILVRFGIPRPDAAAADASAVDERDLNLPRP